MNFQEGPEGSLVGNMVLHDNVVLLAHNKQSKINEKVSTQGT